jgi:beta-glucosidase/6-phospho-beta-glucosidase/beta-galactosidase
MRLSAAVVAFALSACGQRAFSEKFLFGASIAGFQADPGCPTKPAAECEDRNSDWYQFVTSESALEDLKPIISFEPLAHGPGFWELYAQDFDRARNELGLNAVRLSIEWSRIFPTATDGLEGAQLAAAADASAVAAYHAQLQAMKARGLTPLVTLNHYTLPVWLHDGVACHQNLSTCTNRGWLDKGRLHREIVKYSAFVAKEFGGEVDLWATLNEPFAVVLPGYLLPSADRVNPPGLSLRIAEAKQVMVAMIEAHAKMYDAVKANDTGDLDGDGRASFIGLVYPLVPAKPKDPSSRLDQKAAQNLFYLYNTAFLDGVVKGLVDHDLDGKPDTAEPRADLVGRMDYLGLNYYTRVTVKGLDSAAFPTLSPLTTFEPTGISPWEDYPKGLSEMARYAFETYGLPVYVTETGADGAADGEAVARWMVRCVEWTRRAIKEGVDVRGFFVWSLTDNYEWNHGMAMKFGLYAVANDAAKTRTPRSAVQAYADIVRAKDVPAALLSQYPVE